jgi:energy-coupling factor transporter ATP-binding protein EcfA2
MHATSDWTEPQRSIHETAQRLTSLQIVPGLTSKEAAKVHLRVGLYNLVTANKYENLHQAKTYYRSSGAASFYIPADILLRLPVPPAQITIPYSAIKILPAGEIKPTQMVEFLNSLRVLNHFIAFEIIREVETVYFRLQYPTESENKIVQKLNLYFPDFELIRAGIFTDPLRYHVKWLTNKQTYKPIRYLREFSIDPYAHFSSLFDNTAPKDVLCYQILFAPLTDAAATKLKDHLTTIDEKDREYDKSSVKNYSGNLAKKIPAWIVSFTVSSTNEQLTNQLAQSAASSLGSSDLKLSSTILRTNKSEYFPPPLLPVRFSLLETAELASLAHFPITELPIERLEKISMKNVPPPELYTTGDMLIGESRARGQMFPVTLPESVRDRHVYLVGKSGTGKSTLIEAIARRDIEAGGGVAVIDPHGDLINHLLETMPEHRVADCVLFSPKHFPVSLEILSAENEHEIDLLSDDLITMFRRTSESWGDKMQAILQMAFQTLLRVPGSSFTDITPLLTDENYRNHILSQIDHPQLASFWQQRYDMRQAEPILIRMDRLTTSGTLRSVLTQTRNSLNFYDVITESKIFLADLSKGFLGESTSHLIGSIIVSQIQLAAMRQAHLPIEQRIPFSLFVDEVQNFTTSAFSTILSEARKQKLRLTIAHQFVSQLPADLQKAVFGNVGTLVFFALSPDDLGAARHELGTFEPSDVANLPKYHALCRPATAARDTFSFATDPPPPLPARNYTETIIEQTRQKYAAQTTSKAEPQVTSAPVAIPPPTTPAVTDSSQELDMRRPAPARPRQFPINTEKIMHFVRLAEYLSQPQIIAITGLQASNASTALKRLVDTDQLKSLDERRPKIYFIGRSCNATVHNLLVRDLVVKIFASNYAIRALKFNDQLTDLNPDLTIEFLAEDGTPLLAYFELDRGTEGVAELVRKAERYALVQGNPRVCFVFEREPDMLLARKTIEYPFITYATLDQFTSLRDRAFYAVGGAPDDDIQLPFFR